jgi:hypothetical protein
MIVLDDPREVLEKYFRQVEYVGASPDNPYALEKRIPVFICKGARFRLPGPTLAHFEALAVRQERRTHLLLTGAIAVRWPAERLPP